MNLHALLAAAGLPVATGPDPDVTRVVRDSRVAGPGAVFVAVRGAAVDGHDLTAGLGVAAIVAERPVVAPAGVPVVLTDDTRLALARLGEALHGKPSRSVPIVGVTGTNGKSTTVALLAQAASHPAIGWASARIGTLGTWSSVSGADLGSGLTTPEGPELSATLRRLVDEGVRVVALEASSIGIDQRRLDGLELAVGVFTNLTRDHLDHHGTMEAYAAAKARLFTDLLRPAGGAPRAILWGDDPWSARMGAPQDRWTFGVGPGVDFRIEDLGQDRDGLSFRIDGPAGTHRIRTRLIGAHNARNLTAAYASLVALGADPARVVAAFEDATPVDGRLETVPDPRGVLVVVDYAHSADALAAALGALRPLTPGRLWVVFGCGGDRDRGKRPEMGRIAEALADRVVLTSDNPRSEDPATILAEIAGGLTRRPFLVEPDRGEAIAVALRSAAPGDTVLVAGKGHERYQEIAGMKRPFDDRDAIARARAEP